MFDLFRFFFADQACNCHGETRPFEELRPVVAEGRLAGWACR